MSLSVQSSYLQVKHTAFPSKTSNFVIYPFPISPASSAQPQKFKFQTKSPSCFSKILSIVKRLFCKNASKREKAGHSRFIKSQNDIARFHKVGEYVPKNKANFRPLKIDAKLFSSKKALKRKHLLKDSEVAVRASSQGIPTINDLAVAGLGNLVPKRFENKKIINNEILPTSHLISDPKDPTVDHLVNTFSLVVDGRERAIVRSGKIDTLRKAKDFAQLMLSVRDEIADDLGKSDIVLRVVSNQLNSFEMEQKLVENQHRYLALMNKRLKGKVEIVHFNTPVIGFYDLAKTAESIPIFKGVIQKLLFKNSEQKSREQNLEGWGLYFNWIGENHPELAQLSTDIKDIVNEINRLNIKEIPKKKAIDSEKSKAQQKKIRKKLKRKRKELKLLLVEGHSEMQRIQGKLDPSGGSYRKLSLFSQILASQLRMQNSALERGHEQMILQTLNTEIKATASVNCRSGLDRSGFLHSLMLSLETTRGHLNANRVHDLASNWTEVSSLLNLASLQKDGTRHLLKNSTTWEAEQLSDAIEFRKSFLTHLIRVGLPITTINTGYMGFKWQSGVYFNVVENRIPLNFLPPTVTIKKKGKKIEVPLVKYHSKTGKPLGLTRQGRQLLTKYSEMRGA